MTTKISAHVNNSQNSHKVTLTTGETVRSLTVEPKSTGVGSSVNGGELLFLALATCFCNDIYREAAKRGITVRRVEVMVSGHFDDAPGSPAQGIRYAARVEAEASEAEIADLMAHTDSVAEIQNTLRSGVSVVLHSMNPVTVG